MPPLSDGDTTREERPGAPTTDPEPSKVDPGLAPGVDLAQALAILEAALEEPVEARERLLDRACSGRPALRRTVESMLQADARASALDTTPGGVVGVLAEAVSGLVLPDHLGRFEILGLLGQGGMGVVYEAQQRDPDRRIALKTLNLSVSPALSPRVRAEAQAMARLLHVGIPQIYEVFEHAGQPVLAMELVRGESLSEATRRLDRRDRLQLLIRIAEAIEHAHSRGVVHRDLKPSNILVTPAGQPKILDFGIASIGGDELLRAGTPAYMPPEQRRGASPDAQVDVYALGVVAWEVLTGSRPELDDRRTADDDGEGPDDETTADNEGRTPRGDETGAGPDGKPDSEKMPGGDGATGLDERSRGDEGPSGLHTGPDANTPPADNRDTLPEGLAGPLREAMNPDPKRRLRSVQALRGAWLRFLDEDAVDLLIRAAEAESAKITAIAEAQDHAPPSAIEGHLAAARFGLEQALTLAPNHGGARRALDRAFHRAAQWRLDRGELELAAYHLDEASVDDPELRARLHAARLERARRAARTRPPSQIVMAGALLFAVGAAFLGYFALVGKTPGYGLFALSSAVLLVLALATQWRWRALIRGSSTSNLLAALPIAIPVLVSLVDLGAWLRGWPPEQSHALALPIIAGVATVAALSIDLRYITVAILHALLWLASAAMPGAIYGFLAVSALSSAAIALLLSRTLRAIERKTREEP